MNRFWSALAFIGLAAASGAQTVVYEPVKTIGDQHISLRGWGSGTIAQTDEMAYQGTLSIRVSGRNFFQGGIMTFGDPVDLSQQFSDKANMLRLTYQVPTASTTFGGPGAAGPGGKGPGGKGPGGPGGGPGGPGGAGPGGPGAAGGRGAGGAGLQGGNAGVGGAGQGRGIGGQGTSQNDKTEQPPLTMIRIIVTTTDGKKSEAYLPLTTSESADHGWKQVAIPLQSITGFDNTNKDVKEIAMSGDSIATFYVGDIRVINDTTPISGEARIDRTNMALGDTAVLTAYGYGGSSVLTYSWDFDSDGKPDAEGAYVKHQFRTPGDFTITLTVADKYGMKKPYTSQIKVHVNP